MPSPANCTKKYAYIKIGCETLRRIVHEEGKKKFVKLEGKNVLLSTIRGKFRYGDK